MKLCLVHLQSWPKARHGRFFPAVLLGCLLLLGTSATNAQAQGPLDVRLVIDISGSMAEVDPDNRRADALSMFIRTLPSTAQAGIWTFGGQVNALVRHDRVGPLWKNIALTRTSNLPAHALRSNLPAALEAASWDWEDSAPEGSRHILLLTDGAVDISDDPVVNAQAATRLLQTLVPRLKQADIRLHVLAMADAPGAPLLGQLAAATGGVALEGITPDGLLSEFMAAIDSVAPTSQVPEVAPAPRPMAADSAAEQPAAKAMGRVAQSLASAREPVFRIDAGIGSVDMLWVAPIQAKLQLTDPEGKTFTRAGLPERSRWHVGRGFELVSIANPKPGLWRLSQVPGVAPVPKDAPQARMLAYADLQLELLDGRGAMAPQALQSVDAQLSNGRGQAITDPDFLKQVQVHAYLDTPGGSQVVVVEPGTQDGQYRATLPALMAIDEGVLRFEAISSTFARGVRMPFQVRSPVQLELQPQGQGALGWVKLGLDGLAPDTLAISAKVRRPPAPAQWVPARKQPGGLWKLLLDGGPGVLEIELDVRGKYLSQKEFSFRSEAMSLQLPLAASLSLKLDESGRQILPPAPGESPAPQALVQTQAPEPNAAAANVAPKAKSSSISNAEPPPPAEEAAEQPLPPPEPSLPLWFVGVVALLNLGVCGGLAWLLRPAAASRELLAALQAQLADDPEPEPA